MATTARARRRAAGASPADATPAPGAVTDAVPTVFDRTVAEGERRLGRRGPELLATAAVGGMDISVGIYALAATKVATGSEVAGALAFGLGFIALTLANSELFTENFLVPVAPIVAGRARPVSLARLWGAALVMNLVGGWVMMGIVVGAFPRLRPTIVAIGTHYAHLGIGWTSFAAGVLGGVVITLMTWMEHSSESMVARLTAAVGAAFLLAIGPLDHAIVVSLEMFGALQAGARFGYLDWLGVLGWASLANIAGGLGFVTCLRLVQVGRKKIEETAAAPG